MAITRESQILEISGLRLDQSLVGCGQLNSHDAHLASESRFVTTERAFRIAAERRVDVIVMHSNMLSPNSAAGRAPWFLARCIERCSEIPVVWIEESHNPWMSRYVDSPANLTRLSPGETCSIQTRNGQFTFGFPADNKPLFDNFASSNGVMIGCGRYSVHSHDSCDLWIPLEDSASDRVDDFIAHQQDRSICLQTLRPQTTNRREFLDLCPIGQMKISVELGTATIRSTVRDILHQEVDQAAGRYFSNHPQTQLLLIDLQVSGHGTAWSELWNADARNNLKSELTQKSRHPGCRIRSITPHANSLEMDDTFATVMRSIRQSHTEQPLGIIRNFAQFSQESAGPEWMTLHQKAVDDSLVTEVQHAALHALRTAS